MKWSFVLIFILTAGSGYANERLTVIYDSKNTRSIKPYLPETKSHKKINRKKTLFTLPIETPSMKPGKIMAKTKNNGFLQKALFLVGSDSTSKSWLVKNRENLKKIGAVGLLIQADSVEDIKTMQRLANGLKMIPASAESIAKELGLTHYPILISKDRVEQ